MRASGVIYTVKKHGENAGKQKTHGVRNKAYGLYLPLNFYCKRPPDVQAGVQYP